MDEGVLVIIARRAIWTCLEKVLTKEDILEDE